MFKVLAVVSALLCFSTSSQAGYAQLAPPPGWSNGTYTPAANDASFGRVIHSPNGPTATVGGQAVKMPAAYRLAANAPRIAAAAIFLNPYVRAGVAIATWLGLAKMVWDVANQKWVQTTASPSDYLSDGFDYDAGPGCKTGAPVSAAICRFQQLGGKPADVTGSQVVINSPSSITVILTRKDGSTNSIGVAKATSTCPTGWTVTSAGCVLNPQPKDVNPQEFADELAKKPMPDGVPQELPQPTPLPIEQPSPWINPLPGSDPQHRPFFVPSGDPVPNPSYDPNSPAGPNNQPYIQPGTKIQPSPTPSQPWRVDYQPVNRPQPTKDPVSDPSAQPGSKPGDKDQDPDLCEKNPDIAACENGEVADVPLPAQPKLYERKYPDGLVGIWNQKSDQIKQASAFTLAAQLMPTGLTSGTCPTWPITLEFAWWASYGERDVAPPCWIWDVAKTIVIISALMLARSLIFGG